MDNSKILSRILFPVISGIILYFILGIFKVIDLSRAISIQIQIMWLLVIFIIFLTLVILVFYKSRSNKTNSKESQINGSISIKCNLPPIRRINIQKLKQNKDEKKFLLTWVTFGRGIEILQEKIMTPGGIYPDIIFGINEAGIMIASYLSHGLGRRSLLGIIKTGNRFEDKKEKDIRRREKREIVQFDCPNSDVRQLDNTIRPNINVKEPRVIVIVDSEIKTGRSAEDIIDILKKIYGKDVRFIYISLVGVIKTEHRGMVIDDIAYFGWDIIDPNNKPNFLSFYIDEPGIEPPGEIR